MRNSFWKPLLFILTVVILIGGIIAALYCSSSEGEEFLEFGRFVEIKHEDFSYRGLNSVQYFVYDRHTYLVYVVMVYRDSMSISPYMMLDVYGQITVGYYNTENGTIMPAEAVWEEETWTVTG